MFPTSSSSKTNNDETQPANDGGECPVPMSCLKCWDMTQSREGRDKIRNVLAPLVLTTSIIFLIIGATWARFLDPECGFDNKSARFSISTSGQSRIVSGNGCPGYDWRVKGTAQGQRETAGEYPFTWRLPLIPIIAAKPFYIGTSNSVDGPIGVTLNGVPIWGPSAANGQDAVALESNQYDACGGMSTPPNHFAFSAPITGYYHYRIQPGKPSPSSTGLCPAVQSWYNESITGHSPLIGFMADGIPLYGPYTKNSQIPTDLDQCGGHASDFYPYYHYHIPQNGNYPYTIQCLHGCLDGSVNKALNNQPCQPNTTTTAAATMTTRTTTRATGTTQRTAAQSIITRPHQNHVLPTSSSSNSSSSAISPPIISLSAHIPPPAVAAVAAGGTSLQTTTPVLTAATSSPSKSPTKVTVKPTTRTPSFVPTISTTRSVTPTAVPSSISSKSPASPPTPTAVNNYTSLARMKYVYGGKGVNSTNWSGPASLLAFGFLFFIPSILCLGCMCCQYKQYCCQCCQCDNMGDQVTGRTMDNLFISL